MAKAEIFSQGEEVVSGQIVDSNAAWLSERLTTSGFDVTRHTAVGDKLDDLIALLLEIAQRADICICSGGLGPTVDDLTAEAVAKAFDRPLQFDGQAWRQICTYFAHRKRPIVASNRKQAMLPTGAARLDNDCGTAPGFALRHKRCWFAFVPGVPSEMRAMFNHKVQPVLRQHFALPKKTLVTLKTIGIGESDIQQRLQGVDLPEGVQLGFRAGSEDVQTKLLFPAGFAKPEITGLSRQVADCIGDFVYVMEDSSKDNTHLAQVLDKLLNGRTLAVIETISHGQIAARCRQYDFLQQAFYAPGVAGLYRCLHVQPRQEPAPQAALHFTQTLAARKLADFVLTQVFMPDKQKPDAPVNVHTVLSTPAGILQKTGTLTGNRSRKQNQAASLALDFLRRYLQNKTL